jgi:16S rRNA (guanine966-N2)-methyltransferase
MSDRRNAPRAGPGRLRIIGGQWRGRRLEFPARPDLRPTPDRVRETVFNWLAPVLPGARCLDLFAGSGSLGFEALSRGAAEAWLVEHDPVLARVLTDHVARLGANARVIRDDARRFLRRCKAKGMANPHDVPDDRALFDVVFLDPPYREPIEPWLELVTPVLAAGGRVYVERPLPAGLPDTGAGEWIKRSRAGGVEFGLVVLHPPAHG